MKHGTTTRKFFCVLFAFGALLGLVGCGSLNVRHAMSMLYQDVPSARKKVDDSVGYAVFDIFSLHPGVFSLASGKGAAIDKANGSQTAMRLLRFGVGPGLAIKGGYLYLVFDDAETFDEFVDGRWGGGVLAECSFRFGGFGGSLVAERAFAGNVVAYYRTHTGLSLELVLAGARFWPTGSSGGDPVGQASPAGR